MRVFFAIKPDNLASEQLAYLAKQLATTCSGKNIKKINMHLTLAFLGQIPINQLAKLRRIVNSVTAQAFHFSISELGYWKHNQIIYAGTNPCLPELINLEKNIKNVLSANGFVYDTRTYKPHITLVRKAKLGRMLPNLTAPIRWRVTEWCLLQSKQTNHGTIYISLDRWPLKQLSSQNLSV